MQLTVEVIFPLQVFQEGFEPFQDIVWMQTAAVGLDDTSNLLQSEMLPYVGERDEAMSVGCAFALEFGGVSRWTLAG